MNHSTDTNDVLRRLVDLLEAEQGSKTEEKPTPTVDEAIELFCLSLEARGRAEATVKSYRQRLGLLAVDIGHVQVGWVTPGMIDGFFVDQRRQKGRWGEHPLRPKEEGRLSKATLRGRVQAVKTFFRWCVARGYCQTSPAQQLVKPHYNQTADSRAMDPEDLRAMLAAAYRRAEKGKPRDLAMLLFLADTGSRAGELVTLRRQALRLELLEATVDGKTGPGVVDFTEATRDALLAWLGKRPEVDHDFVFCNVGGNYGAPLTSQGLYRIMKRTARRAGVEGRFNPHSVRHLVGQVFTEAGNLELARQKLRHSDISVTAHHYANQDRARIKRATQQLGLGQLAGSGTEEASGG